MIAKSKYTIISKKEDFVSLVNTLNSLQEYCFDLETTSLVTHSSTIRIVGVGFCYKEGEAYYVPFNSNLTSEDTEKDKENILSELSTSLENETIRKIGHNIKYDARVMNRFGVNVRNIYFDTMVASYCLYGDRFRHNLDDLVLHHLNYIKVRTKTLIPKKSKENPTPSMLDSNVGDVGKYCCEDADYTFRLYKLFHKLIDLPTNPTIKSLFYEIDMPLVSTLLKMECKGIYLDVDKINELRDLVSDQLVKLQEEIDKLAGRELGLTKPADIGKCLYEEHKIHSKLNVVIPLTPKGALSTSASTLDSIKDDPLVSKIIEYKFYTKLMSTYINPLPNHISKHTGFIHPSFSQTRTATARLSCSEPNVQQQPSRSEIGRRIREAYVSRFEGGKLLAVDYSQAELRILAHMAQEQVLLKAYKSDVDVHAAVASEVVYEVPLEDVSAKQRTNCKTVNFGLLYGMRAKKLAATLTISLGESSKIMSKYMKKMIGLRAFLESSREFITKEGYTENFFGRRRYMPKIYSDDQLDQWSAEREGANNKVQSTNADMIRKAMNQVQAYIDEFNLKSIMILQVHDELVFDVHPDEIDTLHKEVVRIMENIVKFDVVMKAEGSYAVNWSEAH